MLFGEECLVIGNCVGIILIRKRQFVRYCLIRRNPLIEEPQRLLRDDMRDTVQASTLLTIIVNGANKLSEIATRAGKDSSTISEPLRSCEISAMLVEKFLLVRVLRKVRRGFIISMILFYVFTISLLCLIVLFWNWEEWIW